MYRTCIEKKGIQNKRKRKQFIRISRPKMEKWNENNDKKRGENVFFCIKGYKK